ncbi:MAG: hypothetical protein MTP17_04060 [Candidatus Midichloria sp.]|nr:MAG: hypothetical protein MTP17_04060 [Candidatus Midichloria sp.]
MQFHPEYKSRPFNLHVFFIISGS